MHAYRTVVGAHLGWPATICCWGPTMARLEADSVLLTVSYGPRSCPSTGGLGKANLRVPKLGRFLFWNFGAESGLGQRFQNRWENDQEIPPSCSIVTLVFPPRKGHLRTGPSAHHTLGARSIFDNSPSLRRLLLLNHWTFLLATLV